MLEEKVHGLVQEVERVREDNRRILQENSTHVTELQEQLHVLKEENQTLKDLLTQERQVKEDVTHRIDALLERMKILD